MSDAERRVAAADKRHGGPDITPGQACLQPRSRPQRSKPRSTDWRQGKTRTAESRRASKMKSSYQARRLDEVRWKLSRIYQINIPLWASAMRQ
jgi:hypothetical protein